MKDGVFPEINTVSSQGEIVATQKIDEVPVGLKHIGFMATVNAQNRKKSEPILKEHKAELEVLGVAMGALYSASTCHQKCVGGDHIIEAIGSRVYNLASAAYSLLCIGLYDESQSLIRSIGEIANIVALSVSHPDEFQSWLKATKQERINKFGPAKVRKILEQDGFLLMDKDWYSKLCEAYTHITPETAPNNYDLQRNACGGFIQQEGLQQSLSQLVNICSMVALFYCKHADLSELFEELAEKYTALPSVES